jgi:hypothetical protein
VEKAPSRGLGHRTTIARERRAVVPSRRRSGERRPTAGLRVDFRSGYGDAPGRRAWGPLSAAGGVGGTIRRTAPRRLGPRRTSPENLSLPGTQRLNAYPREGRARFCARWQTAWRLIGGRWWMNVIGGLATVIPLISIGEACGGGDADPESGRTWRLRAAPCEGSRLDLVRAGKRHGPRRELTATTVQGPARATRRTAAADLGTFGGPPIR